MYIRELSQGYLGGNLSSLLITVSLGEEYLTTVSRLLEVLRPYVSEVISKPGQIDSITDRALRDDRIVQLMSEVARELLEVYRKNPEKILSAIVSSTEVIKKKLLSHSIDLSEEIEMLIEHDIFMVRLRLEKPEEFQRIAETFKSRYPDDLKEYFHAYLASVLLILAINETSDPAKLRELAEQLRRYSEIIDTYTTTFELMLEQEIDTSIHSTHKTVESLKRVLYEE